MLGITKVLADTAANNLATDSQVSEQAAQTMSTVAPFVMMIALFVLMYFVMIRPQRKKEKEQGY